MTNSPDDITRLLQDWGQGDDAAADRLTPLVYEHLRKIAHRHMLGERADHTLNTTALVHEAWFDLIDQDRVEWQNRAHFFGIASRLMRRILLMYARRRNRQKRGGGQKPLPLDEQIVMSDDTAEGLIDLDDALKRLELLDERLVRVVECRYFTGLTIEETADVLAVSPATVKRDWQTARAWLHRELGPGFRED